MLCVLSSEGRKARVDMPACRAAPVMKRPRPMHRTVLSASALGRALPLGGVPSPFTEGQLRHCIKQGKEKKAAH